MPATIDLEQTVRVVNTSDVDWESMANGKRYAVPANSERFFPLWACCVWLGNLGEYPTERRVAVEKIRAKHRGLMPPLEVYEQESGVRIWFPADDPDGTKANYTLDQSSQAMDPVTLRKIQEMEAKIATLLAGQGQSAPAPDNRPQSLSELPTDLPLQYPVES